MFLLVLWTEELTIMKRRSTMQCTIWNRDEESVPLFSKHCAHLFLNIIRVMYMLGCSLSRIIIHYCVQPKDYTHCSVGNKTAECAVKSLLSCAWSVWHTKATLLMHSALERPVIWFRKSSATAVYLLNLVLRGGLPFPGCFETDTTRHCIALWELLVVLSLRLHCSWAHSWPSLPIHTRQGQAKVISQHPTRQAAYNFWCILGHECRG